MRKLILPAAVVGAAVVVIVLLVTTVFSHADTATIDAEVASHHYPKAPSYDVQMPLLGTSRTSSLSAFKGRVVLVNIFATWCDPCQAEAPLLAHEQKLLAGHGGTVLGIAWQSSSGAAQQFERQYHLSDPVLRDVSGDVARSFGTDQVPESFVIDPAGKIVALERSQISQQWITQNVTPLLAGGARAS